MSIRIMTQVWKKAPYQGTKLLMLLAIADHANDDGIAYPGTPHLARKCRITKRQAQRTIDTLCLAGELEIISTGGGRGHKRVYQMSPFYLENGEKVTSGAQKGDTQGTKGDAGDLPSYTEPLLTVKKTNKHKDIYDRSIDIIFGNGTDGGKLALIARNAQILSEDGQRLLIALESETALEIAESRLHKVLENHLLGSGLRPVFVVQE